MHLRHALNDENECSASFPGQGCRPRPGIQCPPWIPASAGMTFRGHTKAMDIEPSGNRGRS
jgi:hypothetical protein